ncbi:CatB-related O-acetyltransferase [Ornithinibacillus californiensis]|uniref:CatB-related O-acetyltransferase n=1 Tax=Ornithinibacillus californiensis TaxID=161536 RepID=UPI00069D5EF2|nr:CatB-related O-acetyltransferase [Ornithinibacillus californiensis]
MRLIKKIAHRLFRILTFKKGVYGSIGKRNKFTKGVFITEGAIVGSNNYIGPYSMINNAVIGNYCSLGPNVKLGQGDHSLEFITTYQKISGELIGHSLNSSPSKIGNDVWCGANVVVLQGVNIGDGAVIGANAVVTKDIPDYAIAVGIPARVIKYRFPKEKIEIIKNSNWFHNDIEQAKKMIQNLERQLMDN